MSNESQNKLEPLAAVLWTIWVIGVVVHGLTNWLPLIVGLAIYFAILEGRGIANHKKGDTFSEYDWSFYKDKPARISLTVGFAIDVVLSIANIYYRSETLHEVALGFLTLGVLIWLIWHLVRKGIDG